MPRRTSEPDDLDAARGLATGVQWAIVGWLCVVGFCLIVGYCTRKH
jgi:hypothetical protein